MKASIVAVIVVAAAFLGAVRAAPVQVHDDDFDDVVRGNRVLVKFFAPWCGHCKRLAPEIEKASEIAPEGFTYATVDCTEQTGLKERFNIKGYPTLLYFSPDHDGKPYTGPRTAEGLHAFAERMSAPPLQPLSGVADIQDWATKRAVSFILFVEEGDTTAEGLVEPVAREVQDQVWFGVAPKPKADVVFFSRAAAELAKGSVVMRIEPGELAAAFPGKLNENERMKEWILDRRFPTINELGPENFQALANAGRLLVVGVVAPGSPRTEPFVEALHSLAGSHSTLPEEVKETYNFGYLDGEKWASFTQQFDVYPDNLPRVVVLNSPKKTFYTDASVDEEDELETLLLEVYEGKVPAQRQTFAGQALQWWHTFVNTLTSSPGMMGLSAIVGAALVTVLIIAIRACMVSDKSEGEEEEAGEGEEKEGEEGEGSASVETKKTK